MKDAFGWFITTKTQFSMSYLKKMALFSIHNQYLQILTVKMFNVCRDLIHEVINKIFQYRDKINYELRHKI